MRLRFCLVCGTEFRLDEAVLSWLEDDEPIECGNCGADVWPLEELTLQQRRAIEKAYRIDTAQTVPTQERFL